MLQRGVLGLALVLASATTGCGLFDFGSPRSGPPPRGSWVKYEPPGASCSDGSPYAFYVQFSETGSENLLLYFQAGGVCCEPKWAAR